MGIKYRRVIHIGKYLIDKFKGKYRLKAPYNQYNQFPRELNGNFGDNDVYIECNKGIKVFHFGKNIVEAYVPSIGRGRNIVKAIQKELEENTIFNIVETDSEVLFRFHADDMDKLAKYLKPKTSGASISPFSTKNLPKTKYTIPDEDLSIYKDITSSIGKERALEITHATNRYIKTLNYDVKEDMALKGLKGKEYLHSVGLWKEYTDYLRKELE